MKKILALFLTTLSLNSPSAFGMEEDSLSQSAQRGKKHIHSLIYSREHHAALIRYQGVQNWGSTLVSSDTYNLPNDLTKIILTYAYNHLDNHVPSKGPVFLFQPLLVCKNWAHQAKDFFPIAFLENYTPTLDSFILKQLGQKDILRLADLISVSVDDLTHWFRPDQLTTFTEIHPFPDSFEGADLNQCYPLMKLHRAKEKALIPSSASTFLDTTFGKLRNYITNNANNDVARIFFFRDPVLHNPNELLKYTFSLNQPMADLTLQILKLYTFQEPPTLRSKILYDLWRVPPFDYITPSNRRVGLSKPGGHFETNKKSTLAFQILREGKGNFLVSVLRTLFTTFFTEGQIVDFCNYLETIQDNRIFDPSIYPIYSDPFFEKCPQIQEGFYHYSVRQLQFLPHDHSFGLVRRIVSYKPTDGLEEHIVPYVQALVNRILKDGKLPLDNEPFLWDVFRGASRYYVLPESLYDPLRQLTRILGGSYAQEAFRNLMREDLEDPYSLPRYFPHTLPTELAQHILNHLPPGMRLSSPDKRTLSSLYKINLNN